MRYPNIYSLFSEQVGRYGGREAFYVRRGDAWEGITWEGFGREAVEFACALAAAGLAPGGKVCVLMGNRPEWPVADVGTITAGGVCVGLYPTSSAEQCRYIINHSDAEVVLADTPAQLDKILRARAELPKVRTLVVSDETAARDGVVSYREFLETGRRARERFEPELARRARAAGADETVIMVYTSGTTGLPKGACLSHRYVLGSVESLQGTVPLGEGDAAFSYLPYCHVAERISGLYTRMYAGAATYFVDDPAKLWDYMLEVGPTVFASLPRFFEKIHARVVSDLSAAPPEERRHFERVLDLGREMSRLRQAREEIPDGLRENFEREAGPAVERVKGYFGGRVRLATSGGAPLLPEVAEFFDAFGLPILQAYGLTENVCVAFNRPDNYKFGTVGPPMPGCDVKLAADGEILVRSEMMFGGYYKEPEKTAEMFDADGWLLTGDLGEMDAEDFLKITGRKKEIIVTSTGKNVAPALVENMLKEHHLISHALVHGDGKSYLVALITLNPLETEAHARAHRIDYEDFADLTRKPEIVSLVAGIVAGVNARVSSTEAVKRFAVLDRDLSVEADEVTPTMKVKRKVVAERYKQLLESLYAKEGARTWT
ncbi:MAG TPA: long-chain fatty acid--CoA ligase [Pyrinomonadaceae bacterium]|jgi:long-chain acyl-CoA synthetase|nr:long-chain fatty acid--CoA ligase [Pyrinomonadaceae bacterium]